MKTRKIVWTEDAWNDYVDWQHIDRKTQDKINQIIKDILRNGNMGIGQAEPLKYEFSGFWSRHINKEHRLVYHIENDELDIISCKTHYKK